jgi:Methyltransferase domain
MLLKNKFLNSIKYYLNNKKDFYSRTEMLNDLILHNKYKSYLEIGVNTSRQPGYNWTGLRCLVKHGVDPNVDTTYNMDSDTFFQDYITQKYDICFIDGLHLHEQCYRDIINCLKNLNQDGCIVVHDCNPIHELTQRRVRASSVWHGDIWKSILKLRQNHDNLEVCTVDTDEGCAYIKFGSQKN